MASVSLEQADLQNHVPEVWKRGFCSGTHRLERASEQGTQAAPISSFDLCSVQTKYLAS